jgi:hypothetical protein
MTLRRADLLGTWQLAHWRIEYQDGRVTLPFGADAGGMLLYGADGWMSATMWTAIRTPVAARSATTEQLVSRAKVLDEYLSYGGRWWLDGQVIVHEVVQSANPVLIGTRQARAASLQRDCLILAAQESVPTERVHRIEWRRVDQNVPG